MNETNGKVARLEMFARAGREHFDRTGDLDKRYVDQIVVPQFADVLDALCLGIEESPHIVIEGETACVIHYTSISTLVSLLRGAEVDNISLNEFVDSRSSSLRLYASSHFNDPDEGNYFIRYLNLPKEHDWVGEKTATHAYIASFIIPDPHPRRDMSDNLAFWRTYGREGTGCSLTLRIPSRHLSKVVYGSTAIPDIRDRLIPVLDVLKPLVAIRQRSIGWNIQEVLAEAFWKSLAKVRYLYKSQAYDYERECRFVIPEAGDKTEIFFEIEEQGEAVTRVRHYKEHPDLSVKSILSTGSSITLGPCVPDPYNLTFYLEDLKVKAGLREPQVKVSRIPYRVP